MFGTGRTGKKAGSDAEAPQYLSFEAEIEELGAVSRKPLWGIVLFLTASIIAYQWRDHAFSGNLPGGLTELLGDMPPVFLIDLILAVSTLSSVIVICGRLQNGTVPGKTMTHLVFPIAFYAIYFAADSLALNFYAVFVAGLTVCTLHQYEVHKYTTKALEMKSRHLQVAARVGYDNR